MTRMTMMMMMSLKGLLNEELDLSSNFCQTVACTFSDKSDSGQDRLYFPVVKDLS